MSKQYKLLFFGSDLISQRVLTKLHNNRQVISQMQAVVPPSKKPRTPLHDLHTYIKKSEIPVFQEFGKGTKQMWSDLEGKLLADQHDIGIVASFGHMIPDSIIDKFNEGMLVVHPSLLPKYRGSCPIQHTILNREKVAGVSVIEISKNVFDAGAILYQASVPIAENTRFSELSETLADLGADGVLQILSDYQGHRDKRIIQDQSKVTSAKMIQPEFGLIEFSNLSALDVQARFNALFGSNTRPRAIAKEGLDPKYLDQPLYFDQLTRVTFDNPLETDILIAELQTAPSIPPGSLHWNFKKDKSRVFIKCSAPCSGKYDWVYFSSVTLSGVGSVKAQDFMGKFMENKSYHAVKNPVFKFRFQ
ncbi:hypothetical protein FGO68_gene11837 [Halteria grandinella]|uniref:methionyl-tRNA formyltransferase n=1 Tax=Halteria grandinella TaxID=5974 RepID=A0A8J8NKZ2_HALGN|nr:hypothetical protein FGO68_gene11837 [Halteria grandinella]